MLRAVKVRIYPNKEQRVQLNKTLGAYRFVYNYMLDLKQKEYKESKKDLSRFDLTSVLTKLRKDENCLWLSEVNISVLRQSILQMLVAYKNFFKEHRGFPKFKSRNNVQTALCPIDAISKKNTFERKTITLTKNLKDIRFKCSEEFYSRLKKYKDGLKGATLTKSKSNKYYLSILIEIDDSEINLLPHTKKDVGIDLGVKDFVITSDGEFLENKNFLTKEEKLLKKLNRQLSKKKNGSNNKNKQRLKIAKLHDKIANKKDYYVHEVVNKLLSNYDNVYMEDLNVKGMLRNHKLAKAISEVGFYKFRNLLETKAAENSKNVGFIDRFYPSSKTCHNCGYIKNDLTLNIRKWTCPECGMEHNRDVNAAINILKEGSRLAMEGVTVEKVTKKKAATKKKKAVKKTDDSTTKEAVTVVSEVSA